MKNMIISETKFIPQTNIIKKIPKSKSSNAALNKTLSDYLKFFTTAEGTDMLQYAYLDDDNCYDKLMKYKKNYYLFNDEVEIIKNNKDSFISYLSDIINIIEIGPGSNHTLKNKTLPIINYTKNLKNYYGIDLSENYLNEILSYIKSNTNNINVLPVKSDFKKMSNTTLKDILGKNCVIFLGSTIANFNSFGRNQILQQIAKFTKKDDLFLLTFDTNRNQDLSLKAYDNLYFHNLVKNILKYFAKINNSFLPYIDELKVEIEWNRKISSIEASFIANKTFSFYFNNYGIIKIFKGQRFKGTNSYKFSQSRVQNLIQKNDFKVLDILNNSDKMQIFICKKL